MSSRFIPSGLRSRLMLLVLLTVGSSTALMVWQAVRQRQAAIASASEEVVLLSRLAAAHEERSVAVARQLLSDIAASDAVQSRDARATEALLVRLHGRASTVRGITALDPRGAVFASTDALERGAHFSGSAWYQRALANGAFSVGEIEPGAEPGVPTLRCGLPVHGPDGRLAAVLGVRLDLEWLRRSAARVQLPEHTTFLIVEREGGVLARHPRLEHGRTDSVVTLPRGASAEWMQMVRGGDGRAHLVAFAPLENGPRPALFVGVSIDEDAVVAAASDTFRRSLFVLLLVGALVSAVAWFGVQRSVLSRVGLLVTATERLRAGDLAARTGMPPGKGELSQLGRAFDDMAAELQHGHEVRARAEAQLRASEARKSAVLEASLDGILVLDAAGRVSECNAAARRLFGGDGAGCVHRSLAQLLGEVPLPAADAAEESLRAIETTARRFDGSMFPVEVAIAPIRDAAGWGLYVATVRDITERKRWERSLEALTFVDDLTGLYNRRGFSMFASQQMRLAARTAQRVALVSVDLDGLKAINDTFGHSEGDRAIVEMAVILRRAFRESDVIARFGGDEFVVLATEAEAAGAETSLERLAERLAQRNRRGDLPWTLGASFGFTRIDPREAPPLADLLAVADARMYEAKRAGRAAKAAVTPPAAPANEPELEPRRAA